MPITSRVELVGLERSEGPKSFSADLAIVVRNVADKLTPSIRTLHFASSNYGPKGLITSIGVVPGPRRPCSANYTRINRNELVPEALIVKQLYEARVSR